MRVVDGGFNKKPEKAKASDVLQSTADMMDELEGEGVEADVIVVVQMRDSPAIMTSNVGLDRTAVLLRFASQDVENAIWHTEYTTEGAEDDGTIH